MKKEFQVIFEDDHLLVVNKAPGLLSIPDRFVPGKPNLQTLLSQEYGRVFVVHRLDRETSGILCFARTEAAHRHLSLQFENRQVEKTYLALVDGVPREPEGRIEKAIAPHPSQAGKMMVDDRGKPALTHYRTVETFRAFALLEVGIETGRTHQIRVHLAAIGHPLAVDTLYGQREGFYLSEIKGRRYNLGRGKEERPLMSRSSLHAWRLRLNHPGREELMTFEAEPPKDFRAMLKQLRKWGRD